jgi:hypothetical protein
MLFALVVDPLPAAIFFQCIGVVLQWGRYMSQRYALCPTPLCPQAVALGVPVIPWRIQVAVASTDLCRVGQDGGAARERVISGVRSRVDKSHVAFESNHFHRLIAHIEVEGGLGLGQDIAEGCGRFDHSVGAEVIEPCDSRGEVDVCGVVFEGDGLDLRTGPYANPESVGYRQFGAGLRLGVEGIMHTERRVLHRGDPILGLRHKSQDLALGVGNAADHDRLLGQGVGHEP